MHGTVPADWPADGLENVPQCPVCGSIERKTIHQKLIDRIFKCAPGEWDLQQCGGCGSGYLDPRPTLATIGLAYTAYCTHKPTGGVDYATASWWRRFRIAQRNSYLNANYGYNLTPTAWNPFFLSTARRRRFDTFTGYLHFPGRGARVLDIGCGNGSFLWQMHSLGWEVCGVEPDSQSAERARAAGLDVRVGLLQQQSLPEASFDAITMFHVIEHLHDPVGTVRSCFKLLKPGGHITLVTPGYGSQGCRRFGPYWLGLDPPRHLVLFTENALRRALEDCGFIVSRPPRTSLKAQESFKASLMIQRGKDLSERHPRLPWFACLRMGWLAAKADRAARKNPACADELVLLGKKPS